MNPIRLLCVFTEAKTLVGGWVGGWADGCMGVLGVVGVGFVSLGSTEARLFIPIVTTYRWLL